MPRISAKSSKVRWREEIASLLKSMQEEDLRDIVNRFFQTIGLRSDVVHGSSEHGKDIVAIVPNSIDVLKRNQTLLVQVKTGNISEERWRNEIKPQFSDVLDHYVQHYDVDEKWAKRYVLVFNGKVTEGARKSIHDYNCVNRIPVETIDLAQLTNLMIEHGFHKHLVVSDSLQELKADSGTMNAILGYMRGVTSSEGRRSFSFSELARGLEWVTEKELNQALDMMVDTGAITPSPLTTSIDERDAVERRYRLSEIITRIYRAGEQQEGVSPFLGVDNHLNQFRDFFKQVVRADYDYIVPVARKGARLLQNFLPSGGKNLRKRLVPSAMLSHVAIPDLKGKKICLFDDTVATGQTLSSVAEMLKSQDAQVSTCALFVHEECPTQNLPNNYYRRLNGKEYATESAKIALDLSTFSDPFEPGRLVLQIHIDGLDIDQFVAWLESKGNLYQTTSTGRFSDRKALTLSGPNFFSPKEAFLPAFVSQEAMCKIRMYIQKSELTCVPISFPIVHIKYSNQVSRCRGRKEWDIPFCKRLPLEWYGNQQGMQCFECSDFHVSMHLGKMFLKNLYSDLPSYNMSLASWKIDRDQLYYYFRNEAIVTAVISRIKSTMLDSIQ